MPSNEGTLSERVQKAYQVLSHVASELNIVSDEFGKCVADFDAALKKLNLGITAWVRVQHYGNEDLDYTIEEIGYCKVDGKWGVALRVRDGNEGSPEERVTTWLFNDAPRHMRLSAIGKVADLLEQLTAQAAQATTEAKTKLGLAKEVVGALKQASGHLPDKGQVNSLSLLDLSMPGGKK